MAIKIDDPKGPVFFKQLRCTKANRQFYMLKFRSMCVDAEERLAELQELNEKSGPVFKIADDPRITRVGKWLRKLSLDELPQLINVLKYGLTWVYGHCRTRLNIWYNIVRNRVLNKVNEIR